MKIVPHAEVEQLAREQYRQKFDKQTPDPVVINREPLIALHAPRDFTWAGLHFRAPPVSYPAGVRLLLAANALRDMRRVHASKEDVRPALGTVARVIRGTVCPVGFFSRLAWAIRCPFATADSIDVEGLIRWLIEAPDQSPVISSPEPATVDLIDGLASFARQFPAWIGPDGWPISYALYLYGTRHLSRLSAREDLRNATAARMAQSDLKDWKDWAAELRSAAGW